VTVAPGRRMERWKRGSRVSQNPLSTIHSTLFYIIWNLCSGELTLFESPVDHSTGWCPRNLHVHWALSKWFS